MFSLQRFIQVLRNDVLAQYKRVLLASGGAFAIGLFVYYINVPAGPGAEQPRIYDALFTISLLLGGGLFTSIIYNDIHHPLERYHSLLLPVSALERFISRYLLSGPLFLLYVLLFYFTFEATAGALTEVFKDNRAATFSLHAFSLGTTIKLFFAGHAIMLLGSIFFRGYTLPKTLVAVLVLATGFGLLSILTVKLVFWDYFVSFWSMEMAKPVHTGLDAPTIPGFLLNLLALAMYCWVLFIGYTCLRDHEV